MQLEQPSAALLATIARANALGHARFVVGDYGGAHEVYRLLYETMLAAQIEGHRLHKGLPLHNMGFARLRVGLVEEAARDTYLAFIEDSLSRAEELPHVLDELARPAAANLRLLGAPDQALLDVAGAIRGLVAEGFVFPNPETLFARLGLAEQIRTWLRPSVKPPLRVFVSSPREVIRERRIVAEVCRQLTLVLPVEVQALLWEGGGPRNPECAAFPPELTGGGAQAVIDDHVWHRLGGYDVYLGILWRRMGTPTGAFRSGTEAEFRLAQAKATSDGRPAKILFYVRDSDDRDAAASDFIRELEGLGLTLRYASPDTFRRAVFDHLAGIAKEIR